MGRRIAIPDAVRVALSRVFHDDVSQVEVVEHSWFARLHWGAVATTRRGRIYLRVSGKAFFGDPGLMLHEYYHVMRQWGTRRLTVWRYVRESLRRGYWNNRFEIEARRFTADNLVLLQHLLASDQ